MDAAIMKRLEGMVFNFERRIHPGRVELRTVEGPGGGPLPQIEGTAAVFDEWTTLYEGPDPWTGGRFVLREKIARGAFDTALSESQDVRALVNHDPSLLLGRSKAATLRLWTDTSGLRYQVDTANNQAGRDAVVSIGRGDMTGSSFGFSLRDGGDKRTTTETGDLYQVDREVLSVNLFDVSPVTYPAYTSTSTGIRSHGDVAKLVEEIERQRALTLGLRRSARQFRRLRLVGAALREVSQCRNR